MRVTVPMLSAVALAVNVVVATSAIALDQSLPAYRPVSGLSGSIKSVGSDTLGHEMTLWAKAFGSLYPDVKLHIEAAGSATAPGALLEGASQFGPMSRPMTAEESAAFEAKYGYKLSRFRVAVDALAVYVNKDNPIPCLTLPQVSEIFSSNRKAPGSVNIRTWGDLGLTGDWAGRPIALYSRNTLSGTYEYFRETALYGGDYKPGIKLLPGSEAVIQNVADDKFAIGYSGIGYKTDGVRTVPLASYYGGTCDDAAVEPTLSGKNPIARHPMCTSTRSRPQAPSAARRIHRIHPLQRRPGATEKAAFTRSPTKYANKS